jgi:large subunit ribosomal protein MRP49
MTIRDVITINDQPISRLELAGDFYEWQPVTIGCAPQPGTIDARLWIEDTDLGQPTTTLADPTWRWRWNPQHAVGRFAATLKCTGSDGSTVVATFELRIVPRKLDIERYEALIMSVQRDVSSIVYALSGGREGVTLQPHVAPHASLVEEYYTLVERHVAEALALVKQIAPRPHQTLRPQPVRAQLPEVDRLDVAALAEAVQGVLDDLPDDVLPSLQTVLRGPERTRGGPVPREVRTTRSTASHDVIEHRLLKHVLDVLVWRVGFVREMVRREIQRRHRNAQVIDDGGMATTFESWQKRCAGALRSLRQSLALPFLAGVSALHGLSGPSHLMRHEPRYRRLYELYRQLRAVPFIALDSPMLWLPIQELPLLYEQWCALQVVKALLPLGTIVTQELVARADQTSGHALSSRWTLRLSQQAPLLTLQCADGTTLTAYYQRRYQPQSRSSTMLGALDPFVRIPDLAIERTRAGESPQVLIFDAKYRVASDGSVPQDALDDAYAYRSAIGVAGARKTLGAFLLFPGSRPLATVDHVGALPCLPDASADLAVLLRRLLDLPAA